MSRLVATFFLVGLMRPAPGSWAALAALPLAWGLHGAGGFPLLAAATAGLFALGWWAVARETATGEADPPEIVVDEVVGQWLALWPLSAGLWAAGVAPWTFPWPGWAGAFLAFRLLDIWKPWPISRLDALPPPAGVMLDDAAAGLLAAVVVAAAAALAHGLLLA